MRTLLVAILAAIILPSVPAQAWENPESVAAIYVEIDDQVTDGCWPRPQATKEAVELVFRQAGIIVAEDLNEWHELTWPPGYLPLEGLKIEILKLIEEYKQDEITKEVQELKGNLKTLEVMSENDKATIFYKFPPHVFAISALGFGITDLTCAVSVNVRLSRREGLYKWQFFDDRDMFATEDNYRFPAKVDYGSHHFITTGGKAKQQASITDSAVEQATSLANAILKARTEYGLTTRK